MTVLTIKSNKSNRGKMSRVESVNRDAGLHERVLAPRLRKSRPGHLLSTVAASALTAAAAFPTVSHAQTVVPPSSATCAVNGTVATCTGDLSEGVQANAPLTTLNVNNLTQDIAPTVAGVNGIEFDVTGDQNITVNSDTGPFQIVTTRSAPGAYDGYGIGAQVTGNGNVVITSTGNISSGNDGIKGHVSDDNGTLLNAGNGNVTIINSGDITSTDERGIDANVDKNGNISVFNVGDISSLQTGIYAHVQDEGDVRIVSTGKKISAASGNGISGRVGNGGNVSITSGSTIAAKFRGISGLVGGDGSISINNTGDITTTFGHAIRGYLYGAGRITIVSHGKLRVQRDWTGINAYTYNTTEASEIHITNTGDIASIGGYGIWATTYTGGGRIVIANSGQISGYWDGISLEAQGTGSASVFNTGSIISTGTDRAYDSGIDVAANRGVAPATITNSGLIRGASGFAINLRSDGNDVVNLLPGSIIDGAIDFGNGNNGLGGANLDDIDTLNFAAGLNATVDFADSGGPGQGGLGDGNFESAPEIINFAGAGVVVNGGLTAVAVDVTGFALQGTFASDLTDAILNSIDNGGGVRRSRTELVSTHGAAETGEERTDHRLRVWGSAFGGYNDVEADGRLVPFDHNFWGLLSGIETGDAEVNGVFGLLGGYSDSRLSVAYDTGETEIDSYFGGLYWKRDFGAYRVHAAFLAGATDNKVSRSVNGIDANGDFDGMFYSPSLTVLKPIDLFAVPMSVSARANYVYMHLDGYTETGIPLPLTVDDRAVSLFNARAQVNFPRFFDHADGNATRVNLAVGLDATLDAGSDDVAAVVAGVPFSFVADTEDEVAGFVGINVAHSWGNGRHTVGFDGELQSAFDGGIEATGGLKASFRF